MTASELMRPRFEVIGTYPKSKFLKGDILERIPNATEDWYNADKSLIYAEISLEEIEKYPHLFRKMNWWEKRTIEQMPKKLMSMADERGDTFEIEEWDLELSIGWIDKKKRSCCSLLSWKPEFSYIPID